MIALPSVLFALVLLTGTIALCAFTRRMDYQRATAWLDWGIRASKLLTGAFLASFPLWIDEGEWGEAAWMLACVALWWPSAPRKETAAS